MRCVWEDEAGACLDGPAVTALGLPASLYLGGSPPWWNAAPFPPFGPDPDAPGTPRISAIPAEDRFHTLTGR